MQIINNTGAIIKEQINLGDIDNLNIDDLFKNNTSKKMKNNNYPTWLVPIEIAKELKEIGFKEKCLCYWHEYFHRIECSTDDEDRLCPEYYDYNTDESTTSLPTWEQVFEWFREKGYHGVIAARGEDGENEYSYCIDYLNELSSDFEQDSHLTYEEAREALVKALIRTYKSEQL
nr:MAG TPA: hypothetical protein [Caudoviricetes sp.]